MNNREICFRIWDSHLKEMLFEGFHLIGEIRIFGMIQQHVYENPGSAKSSLERYGDFIEMQFIGLRDKNGKNLYESDIIKDEQGRLWVIFWHEPNCQFRCKQLNRKPKKFDGRIGEFSTGCQKYFMDMVECVGNLYANPELSLTSKTEDK